MNEAEKDTFYKSRAWRRLRAWVLARDHYWCQVCGRAPANTVHHIEHLEDRPDLALSADNLQAICAACHNREHPEKTARNGKTLPEIRTDGLRVVVIGGQHADQRGNTGQGAGEIAGP